MHVLCVLAEADELKQGPAVNQDEIKVITDGRKILDDLTKKINEFTPAEVELDSP